MNKILAFFGVIIALFSSLISVVRGAYRSVRYVRYTRYTSYGGTYGTYYRSSGGGAGGAITGYVFAGIAVACGIALLVWYLLKRSNKKKQAITPRSQPQPRPPIRRAPPSGFRPGPGPNTISGNIPMVQPPPYPGSAALYNNPPQPQPMQGYNTQYNQWGSPPPPYTPGQVGNENMNIQPPPTAPAPEPVHVPGHVTPASGVEGTTAIHRNVNPS